MKKKDKQVTLALQSAVLCILSSSYAFVWTRQQLDTSNVIEFTLAMYAGIVVAYFIGSLWYQLWHRK